MFWEQWQQEIATTLVGVLILSFGIYLARTVRGFRSRSVVTNPPLISWSPPPTPDFRVQETLPRLLRTFEADPDLFRNQQIGRRFTFSGVITNSIRSEQKRVLFQVEVPSLDEPLVAICDVAEERAEPFELAKNRDPVVISARLRLIQPDVPQFLFERIVLCGVGMMPRGSSSLEGPL